MNCPFTGDRLAAGDQSDRGACIAPALVGYRLHHGIGDRGGVGEAAAGTPTAELQLQLQLRVWPLEPLCRASARCHLVC